MKKDNAMLKSALKYARTGIPVFPVKYKDKIPLTGSGFKDATTDEKTIRAWWGRWPNANIGIPTGEVSGLLAFDVDVDKGGFESLKTLEEKYSLLPQTLEVITGGGGLHRFYIYPKGADIRNSAGKLGAGLDVRGKGGYVVAAPSLHASGRRYRKSESSSDRPAQAPEWFLSLLQSSKKNTAGKGNKKTVTAPIAQPSLSILCRGVREGRRNDSLARLAGGLLRFQRGYLDPELVLELLLAWNDARCYPSLSRQEVMQVVNSIAGAEINKIKARKV